MKDPPWFGRAVIGVLLVAVAGLILSLVHLHRQSLQPPAPAETLGATFALAGAAQGGTVIVTSLRSDGPAANAGLMVGDMIETVDGAHVASVPAIERRLMRAKPVDMRVLRGAQHVEIKVAAAPGGRIGAEDPAGRGRYGHG